MLGAAVAAQLAPAHGDLFEFVRSDVVRGRHDFGELVEIPTPVSVARGQEEILFGGEVFVDRALGIAGRLGDVVESRGDETLFGEHLLGGIQQQRAGALEAALARHRLDHDAILPQNFTPWSFRYSLVYFRRMGHFRGWCAAVRSTRYEETVS
jgi:hypothetical protein